MCLLFLIVAESNEAGAETAYVYGRNFWWTTGDTIQFMGDANSGSPAEPCPQWPDGCPMDNGLLFRKVTNVDVVGCTYDTTLTCYAAAVSCCFWVGGCTGQDAETICGDACEGIEETCPSGCYCRSLWTVREYNPSSGDGRLGCYEIELVCETYEPCLHMQEALPCETVYGHWSEDALGEDLGFRTDTEILWSGLDEDFCPGTTMLQNDSGVFTNGYCWRAGGVVPPDYGSWAEGYDSGFVCGIQFLFTQTGSFFDQTMDVYVWESDGGGNPPPGPDPGNVLCALPGITPGPIAMWPEISMHDVLVCCETDGPHFVGFWGDWPGATCAWYVAADETGDGLGIPRTKIAPGIGYPTGWQHPNVQPIFANCRDLGIREFAGSGGCPPTPTRGMTWGRIKALY
jgi:hypothetical protein